MNYRTLPPGCRLVRTLDFSRSRRQMLTIARLGLALLLVPLAAALSLCPPRPSVRGFIETWPLWAAMLGMQVLYIPLHELTHGLSMLLLSGMRPSYGIRLPYAWCGSDVWFDRRSHVITALAPLTVWGLVFHFLILRLPGQWFWPVFLVQLSNLSGSAGDIYSAWLLMHMDGELLIQDTGTRMRVMRLIQR